MKKDEIEQIVKMLDENISKGVGKVKVQNAQKLKEDKGGAKSPCAIPNFENIEDRRKI